MNGNLTAAIAALADDFSLQLSSGHRTRRRRERKKRRPIGPAQSCLESAPNAGGLA